MVRRVHAGLALNAAATTSSTRRHPPRPSPGIGTTAPPGRSKTRTWNHFRGGHPSHGHRAASFQTEPSDPAACSGQPGTGRNSTPGTSGSGGGSLGDMNTGYAMGGAGAREQGVVLFAPGQVGNIPHLSSSHCEPSSGRTPLPSRSLACSSPCPAVPSPAPAATPGRAFNDLYNAGTGDSRFQTEQLGKGVTNGDTLFIGSADWRITPRPLPGTVGRRNLKRRRLPHDYRS